MDNIIHHWTDKKNSLGNLEYSDLRSYDTKTGRRCDMRVSAKEPQFARQAAREINEKRLIADRENFLSDNSPVLASEERGS